MYRSVLGFLSLALLLQLTPARAQPAIGQRILEQRTVILSIRSSSGSFECLGFRLFREDFPPNVEPVLTAAHCLTNTGTVHSIAVKTLNQRRGYARNSVYWSQYDVAFLLVTPSLGSLEPVGDHWQRPPYNLPVIALIRVGGGSPTITSGLVKGQDGHNVVLLMPAAPGSSGGAVVDVSGQLVGLISRGTGAVNVPNAAGFLITSVGADLIMRLLGQQDLALRERARALSLATASPASPVVVQLPAPPPVLVPTSAPSIQPPPTSQAPGSAASNTIQAGEGIGPLKLGMTIQQALQAMGPFLRSATTSAGGTSWTWNAPGPAYRFSPRIVAFAREVNGPITDIQTTSPVFTTVGGNRVGARLADLIEESGANYRISTTLLLDLPVAIWPGLYVTWDSPLDQSSGQRVDTLALIGVRR